MTRSRFAFQALGFIVFTLALASAAQAQATRTFVSGVGNDADPCSRTAPCRTFSGALIKTFINGEINALDPGGFGTVSITKSVTIDGGDHTHASILASGTTGVTINIAVNVNDPHRRVTLRRLSINGTGPSGAVGTNTGIRGVNVVTNGLSQLYVEDCYIQNFTTTGIRVDFAAPAAGTRVSVKNTKISNITGGAGTAGIEINTSTNFIAAVLDNVRVEGTATGVNVRERAFVAVRDSLITNNSSAGVAVNAAPSNTSFVSLERSYLFSTTTGVAAGAAGTTVDLSNTTITQNVTGISSGGATVNSHGNNQIFNNVSAGITPNPVGQQ